MTEYTKAEKVTQDEIVTGLKSDSKILCDQLADRIQQHGIAVELDQAKQICEANGFVVVPKEPTPEMLEAGNVALIRIKNDPTPSMFNRAFYTYTAMLEAAKENK